MAASSRSSSTKGLTRAMLRRYLSNPTTELSSGKSSSSAVAAAGDCYLSSNFEFSGDSRCCGSVVRTNYQVLEQRRQFRTSVQGRQQSQLESDSAQGFQNVPLPLRNYSPVLSGFSVLPNTAVGVPAGLSPPSNAGSLNLDQLGREMSNRLSQGRLEESVRLFENWLKFPDLQGRTKVPNVMTYNLLLHAKLRLGVDPRYMLQVIKDMQMSRLKPNLLSYNFLLRAIFRQRDSKMAERTLEKMEQSGPEAQPDGDSYNLVIVLCALERRIDAAMSRFQAMLNRGYVPSKTTYNELLLAAVRMQRSRVAVDILKDLKKRNIVPQLQTVVELAVTAAEVDDSECANRALELLSTSELSKITRNLNMDEGGMYHVLSLAARVSNTALSKQAWSILRGNLRESELPSPSSYLARIHALASAGDFDTAFVTLRELESLVANKSQQGDREILSPFSSLRPLVVACTRGGFAALDAAYYKLAEMNASGQPVTLSAVNCVIQGCSNIWDFDRAYQTFETIGTTFGLMPDVHSCNSLLDVFGKTRKMPEVLKIFDYMHEVGVIPDERTYSLLVDAHVVNRDPKAAMDALNLMTKAGHIPQRQTVLKIWRRYVKQDDKEGARLAEMLMQNLGYRDCHTSSIKWQEIASI
ncbi:unnamed protein product [Calypogeia fissa]